jgi:hypothetical protein
MEHPQEDWFRLNRIVLPLVISVPHKTITIPLGEVVWRAVLEMSTQQLQAEEMLRLLEVRHSLLDHLQHQAAPEEDTTAIRIQILTILELLVRQTVVHPITGPVDQTMALHVRPLMVEASQMATILEAHRAGRAQTLLTTVRQADLVLEQATVLQVEVQVDPQAAQAQEDPEEGGINSPFFLRKLSENPKNFVTTSTYPITHEVTSFLSMPNSFDFRHCSSSKRLLRRCVSI